MIKIELENSDLIKEVYFEGIKNIILDRVDFYLAAFKIIDRQSGYNSGKYLYQNFKEINTKTKTSFLKIFGISAGTISKKDDYYKLEDSSNLNPIYYDRRSDYIDLLTKLRDEEKLKVLILSNPNELFSLDSFYKGSWYNEEQSFLIKKIIPYDIFTDKDTKPYNAYNLCEALNINVCVYCNRIYTNTIIGKNDTLIIRPTLDHFFHQKDYPLLALSFQNLIPSCHFCNSNLKHEKHFFLDQNIHPYLEGFAKDATFDYLQIGFYPNKSDRRNYKIILKENIHHTHPKYIRIFGSEGKDNSGNAKVFKIVDVYSLHSDIVGELIVKTDKESPCYIKSLVSMLSSLGASKKEFYRLYFSNYYDENDFHKRPLAKLTKDIVAKYFPEILTS